MYIKILYLFFGVIINHTLSTSYTVNIYSTTLPWTKGIGKVKVESGDGQDMAGGNPALYFNAFLKYSIIPTNIETIQAELNIFAEENQDYDDFHP